MGWVVPETRLEWLQGFWLDEKLDEGFVICSEGNTGGRQQEGFVVVDLIHFLLFLVGRMKSCFKACTAGGPH